MLTQINEESYETKETSLTCISLEFAVQVNRGDGSLTRMAIQLRCYTESTSPYYLYLDIGMLTRSMLGCFFDQDVELSHIDNNVLF